MCVCACMCLCAHVCACMNGNADKLTYVRVYSMCTTYKNNSMMDRIRIIFNHNLHTNQLDAVLQTSL